MIEKSSVLCDLITNTLYEASFKAREKPVPKANESGPVDATAKWRKLLSSKDPKSLWQSVNWNGSFDSPPDLIYQPSDDQFCKYYQRLLSGDKIDLYHPKQWRNIPVLDNDITPMEIYDQLCRLKAGKAAGHDGLSPCIVKQLDDDWINLIAYLFNLVFSTEYPTSWNFVKVFNIFKKGSRLEPSNYRGISIMPAIAKLYDMVLTSRFSLWYTPRHEQAGAQKGRGCEEQILTVRLLIDIARKTKRSLYLAFIDLQKAYDKVNRNILLQTLDLKGCGSKFLIAIRESLRNSMGIIGQSMFEATSGVRQGGCSSCPLFTFFIDCTIDAVNSVVGPDGWLDQTHALLFMDDTVIFATSREMMELKLTRLKQSIDNTGMIIHPSKSQYLTVNCRDTHPFYVGNAKISYTDQYVYLGTPIANSPITGQVQRHLHMKTNHVLKFSSFLQRNSDAPFQVKKLVWESALNSAILYSCQTWLGANTRCVESVYNNSIKQLLGVRHTTCNDLVLTETGVADAKSLIEERQYNFIQKLVFRPDFQNSYLHRVTQLAIDVKCPMGRRIESFISIPKAESDFVMQRKIHTLQNINNSESTRKQTYLSINPFLSVCPIYTSNTFIPEVARIAVSRLRLSSHYLRIETGRWSRIPRENRLCQCGEVQTEHHVLIECPLSETLRTQYPVVKQYANISDLLSFIDSNISQDIARFCTKVLALFS